MITITLTSFIDKKIWCLYILIVAFAFNKYFYFAFFDGGPQVGQYALLQDALEMIPEEAIVFCNPESQVINTRLTSNLRILNDNRVYNLNNFEEVDSFYQQEKYIISECNLDVEGELILSKVYKSQYSFGNGNNGNYSMNIGYYDIPLYVYKVQ